MHGLPGSAMYVCMHACMYMYVRRTTLTDCSRKLKQAATTVGALSACASTTTRQWLPGSLNSTCCRKLPKRRVRASACVHCCLHVFVTAFPAFTSLFSPLLLPFPFLPSSGCCCGNRNALFTVAGSDEPGLGQVVVYRCRTYDKSVRGEEEEEWV